MTKGQRTKVRQATAAKVSVGSEDEFNSDNYKATTTTTTTTTTAVTTAVTMTIMTTTTTCVRALRNPFSQYD